jgi:uncharacterized protein YjbI with pentapeptide repeats
MLGFRFLIILIHYCSLIAYNELHVSKVQEAITKGEQIIVTGGDLRGAGTSLKGKNMSKGLFSGTSFAKNDKDVVPAAGTTKIKNQISDLSGSNFSNAELISVNFTGANLEGTNFDGADVAWTDFSESNLKGASFNGTKNMDKAKFCKATLPDGTVLTAENAIGRSFKPYFNK